MTIGFGASGFSGKENYMSQNTLLSIKNVYITDDINA